MRWRKLIWPLVLLGINLLLISQVVQLWWTAMENLEPAGGRRPPPPPLAIPQVESQPVTAFQVVSSRNLFSTSRREAAKPAPAAKEGGAGEQALLLGTIIIGQERVALVAAKDKGNVPRGPVEVLRVGESWQGYRIQEIKAEGLVLEREGQTRTLSFPETATEPAVKER